MSAPEGFAEFVVTRYASLVRTACLLTGDPGRGEDLVQEALVRSWIAWSSIRRRDRPEVYVQQVMVNLNISWWRRRWRYETPHLVLPEPVESPDPAALLDVRDVVHRALATLPPRQRAVVVLRYFDDLTETQTAAVLGCAVGSVKSHAARAMARLRQVPGLGELISGEAGREPAEDPAGDRQKVEREA